MQVWWKTAEMSAFLAQDEGHIKTERLCLAGCPVRQIGEMSMPWQEGSSGSPPALPGWLSQNAENLFSPTFRAGFR